MAQVQPMAPKKGYEMVSFTQGDDRSVFWTGSRATRCHPCDVAKRMTWRTNRVDGAVETRKLASIIEREAMGADGN